MKTKLLEPIRLKPRDNQESKLTDYSLATQNLICYLQADLLDEASELKTKETLHRAIERINSRLRLDIPFELSEYVGQFVESQWEIGGNNTQAIKAPDERFGCGKSVVYDEERHLIRIYDEDEIYLHLAEDFPLSNEIVNSFIKRGRFNEWVLVLEVVDYDIPQVNPPESIIAWMKEDLTKGVRPNTLNALFIPEKAGAYTKTLKLLPTEKEEKKLEELVFIYNKIFNITCEYVVKTTDFSRTRFLTESTISKLYTRLKHAGQVGTLGYSDDIGRSTRKEITQAIFKHVRGKQAESPLTTPRDITKANHFILTSDRVTVNLDLKRIELMKDLNIDLEIKEFEWLSQKNNSFVIWKERIAGENGWFIKVTQQTEESLKRNLENRQKWRERYKKGNRSLFD